MDSFGSRQQPAIGSCEYSNKSLNFIKMWISCSTELASSLRQLDDRQWQWHLINLLVIVYSVEHDSLAMHVLWWKKLNGRGFCTSTFPCLSSFLLFIYQCLCGVRHTWPVRKLSQPWSLVEASPLTRHFAESKKLTPINNFITIIIDQIKSKLLLAIQSVCVLTTPVQSVVWMNFVFCLLPCGYINNHNQSPSWLLM
jgi:hypothetical protein